MANQEQLAILMQGVEVWNRWREENPEARVDLSKAFLPGVDLRGVNFGHTNFGQGDPLYERAVDLSGADLRGADLTGANLVRVKAFGIHLSRARLVRANLHRAILSEADLRGGNLLEASLDHAHLHKAKLRDADLSNADLRGAALTASDLSKAVLVTANLGQADLGSAHLADANLSGANLGGARLPNANLRGANLQQASLYRARLNEADLSRAVLIQAHLLETDLSQAVLLHADLREAFLRRATLQGAQFSNAIVGSTSFLDLDLTAATGLEEVRHSGPSSISTDTFIQSKGCIPEVFLQGCGLSDWEIENVRLNDPELSNQETNEILYRIFDLRAAQALQISPLFVSYSHADSKFVDKIGDRLKAKGVRYWRDIHEMKAGRIEKQIDHAIRQNPTVLLVLSENSLRSDWVEHEVRAARDLEKEMERDMLCPVALDDSWKTSRWPRRIMEQIMEFNILDFSAWQDDVKFDSMFRRLIDGLELFYRG